MNSNLLNGLNVGKLIKSLNRALDTANKAIPLYNQIKPIIKNASTLTNMLNIINTPDNNNIKENNEKKENNIKNVSNNNLPTFFQ